jgi:hypothetical protein
MAAVSEMPYAVARHLAFRWLGFRIMIGAGSNFARPMLGGLPPLLPLRNPADSQQISRYLHSRHTGSQIWDCLETTLLS